METLADLNDKFHKRGNKVDEVFGSFQTSIIGCGRPAPTIPNVSEKKAIEHIEVVHSHNLEFNYLLNSTCLGNREFDRKSHIQILNFVDRLVKIEVDKVTIATPYLVELVKEQFPSLKIKASTLCGIDSARKAIIYENLGVDTIELNPDINRNFEAINSILRAMSCDLEIHANRSCLLECPFLNYHFNLASHASQETAEKKEKHGKFYVDYCMAKCFLARLIKPAEFIMSPWVRPEDIETYEKFGIKSIKLSGRRMPSDWLARCARAYLSREYNGNLIDLIYKHNSFMYNFVNKYKKPYEKRLPPLKIELDNRLLQDFLIFFIKNKNPCSYGCEKCHYCWDIAKTALKMDSTLVNQYTARLRQIVKWLTKSNFIDENYLQLREMWIQEAKNREIM